MTRFAILAATLALLSCTHPTTAAPPAAVPDARAAAPAPTPVAPAPAPAKVPPEVVKAMNQFSLELYLGVRDQSGNLILSPSSIAAALGMTSAGARGLTLRELASALHLDGIADRDAALGALLDALAARDGQDGLALRVANRVWVRPGLHLAPGFAGTMHDRYRSSLGELDLARDPEAARAAINRWIADQTAQRIPELFARGQLAADSQMVLTNAIYFKGAWKESFRKELTRPAEFRSPGGKQIAQMMHADTFMRSFHDADVDVVELPYRGGMSMLIVVPIADDGLAAVEKRLPGAYQGWVEQLGPVEVQLALPRFTARKRLELKEVLRGLGVREAFADSADFSGITTDVALMIDAVVHEGFIEVNEEGAEAAGATGVVTVPTSAMPDPHPVVADHPFLYLIRDDATGAILFIGRVENV
jgi:serpin B